MPTTITVTDITATSVKVNWSGNTRTNLTISFSSSVPTTLQSERPRVVVATVGETGSADLTGLKPSTAYVYNATFLFGATPVQEQVQFSFTTIATVPPTPSPTPPAPRPDPNVPTDMFDATKRIYFGRDFVWRVKRDGEDDLLLNDRQIFDFRFRHGAFTDRDSYPKMQLSSGRFQINADTWTDLELEGWTDIWMERGNRVIYKLKIQEFARNHEREQVSFTLRGNGSYRQGTTIDWGIQVSPTQRSRTDAEVFPQGVLTQGETLYGLKTTGRFTVQNRRVPSTEEVSVPRLVRDWELFAFAVCFEDCTAESPKYTAWRLPLTAASSVDHDMKDALILDSVYTDFADWRHDRAQRQLYSTQYQNHNEIGRGLYAVRKSNTSGGFFKISNGGHFTVDPTSIVTSGGRREQEKEFHSWIAAPEIVEIEWSERGNEKWRGAWEKGPGELEWTFRWTSGASGGRNARAKPKRIRWRYWEADENRSEQATIIAADENDTEVIPTSGMPTFDIRTGSQAAPDNDKYIAISNTAEYKAIQAVLAKFKDWRTDLTQLETLPNEDRELALRAGETIEMDGAYWRICSISDTISNAKPLQRQYTIAKLNPKPTASPAQNYLYLHGDRLELDGQPLSLE